MGGAHSSKTRASCEELLEVVEGVEHGLVDLANDLKYKSTSSSGTRLELVHFLTALARKLIAALNNEEFKIFQGENRSHLLLAGVNFSKMATAIQQEGTAVANRQALISAIEKFMPELRKVIAWLSDLPLTPVRRLLLQLKEATTALLNAFTPVSEDHALPSSAHSLPALRQASAKPRLLSGRWLPIGFRPGHEQSGLKTELTLIPLLLDYLESEAADADRLPLIAQRGKPSVESKSAPNPHRAFDARSSASPEQMQSVQRPIRPASPLTRAAFSQTRPPPPPPPAPSESNFYQQFARKPFLRRESNRMAPNPNRFFQRSRPLISAGLQGSQLASSLESQQQDSVPQGP